MGAAQLSRGVAALIVNGLTQPGYEPHLQVRVGPDVIRRAG